MTCQDGAGDCMTCLDCAPGLCIIDGQYEFYCQKYGFSPRRPFVPKVKA